MHCPKKRVCLSYFESGVPARPRNPASSPHCLKTSSWVTPNLEEFVLRQRASSCLTNLVAMYGTIEGSKSPALTWDKDHVHKLSDTYPHHQTLPRREAHACVLGDPSLRGGNTAASTKMTRDDLK